MPAARPSEAAAADATAGSTNPVPTAPLAAERSARGPHRGAAENGGVPATPAGPTRPPETLTVFAAASLTDAFRALARGFEQTEPHLHVELDVAGSPALVRQILEGAPGDVFAAADEVSMDAVREHGRVLGEPVVFARNSLTIAVEQANPRRITGLADLLRPDVTVALCAPTVPAGRYAREALRRAGLAVPEASQEIDVRAALTKVELGEADAAVVYVTDVRARADRVAAVPIAAEQNVVARYPIARLTEANNAAGAARFTAYVLSADGQRALAASGFLPP